MTSWQEQAFRSLANFVPGDEEIQWPKFPEAFAERYPDLYGAALSSFERMSTLVEDTNYSTLARHSPALEDADWVAYLRLGIIRQLYVFDALRRRGVTRGRLLDLGSYFGNFALMAKMLGYETTAIDSYARYAPALEKQKSEMNSAGVDVLDFASTGFDLAAIPSGSYDVILCLGVIEHIPHTPRLLLETICRTMAPGGTLILETPNIEYIYRQLQLARRESFFSPLAKQYFTEIPFEGHHREYNPDEIRWLLETNGFEQVGIEMHHFSLYGAFPLVGTDKQIWLAGEKDERLREIILGCGTLVK